MKKVALVSNLDEKCGNGEYGRILADQLEKEFEVTRLAQFPEVSGYDAVVFNWHPAVVWYSADVGRNLRALGSKVMVIIQESRPTMDAGGVAEADLVTAHEQVGFIGAGVNFRLVPHGAYEVSDLPEYKGEPIVGTAGFAFPSKRMDITAQAAQGMGGSAHIIAPRHAWYDPTALWGQWQSINPTAVIEKDWLGVDAVIKMLAMSAMNIWFAEEGDVPGQGGSPRMLLGARRPTILRRCSKVSALFPYEDEIYFANTEQEVYSLVGYIWSELQLGHPVRRPNRVLEDVGWNAVGSQYRNLIGELLGC